MPEITPVRILVADSGVGVVGRRLPARHDVDMRCLLDADGHDGVQS